MAATPQEIYQRYLWATLTQNADAVAEMFTVDGVFQAPLVPAGQAFPRKASWQHVFAAPADKQPPLRISAILDNSYRNQLGLDINDMVQGDVGVDVTVAPRRARRAPRAPARRPPQRRRGARERRLAQAQGRAQRVRVRCRQRRPHLSHRADNVRLVGDDVAIEGWMGIGADNKLKEFRFPNFSLNVVTSLETHGKVRPDGIWDVTRQGPTYDGRDLFRSFFDVAHLGDQSAKVRPGLDLRAEVEHGGGLLRHHAAQREDVAAEALQQAHLRSTRAACWRAASRSPRRCATSPASRAGCAPRPWTPGQLFKLVGFYPNAVGGAVNLEVNLDGQGPAERTGTLWVRDFLVLGDPIISEVLQNADGTARPARAATVVREQFEFEIMRVPFSVGHGQFVMHEATINGQLVSASMSGKVDFRAQALEIGGTYVPMSGLMRAPAAIPLLGPLLTGPRGEGMFGITFAIQGSMAKPQVIVNPLSLITPGIFREIFQMTPEDPRVHPARATGRPARDGSRASSAPAAIPPAAHRPHRR